jgi:mono/diheme cytochrome c family protein
VRRGPAPGIAALAALALASAAPAAAESERVLYMLHCQGCHLADGTGSPGAVPSLAGMLGRFPALPGGRAYLVQVPGSAHSPLSDAELAAVLNWMVARFAVAEDAAAFAPYDAAEVAAYRATPLVDVSAARAELVRRMASGD